jgi:ketosteroid isomerase-like protein
VIAEDAVWVVNGTVPVAQRYEGRGRIFELFRETRRLTEGTYLSELRWALAGDEHACAVYRATGKRLGRALDIDQVLLIDHRDGIWTHITAIPSDPPAFEAFWAAA